MQAATCILCMHPQQTYANKSLAVHLHQLLPHQSASAPFYEHQAATTAAAATAAAAAVVAAALIEHRFCLL